MSGGARVDRSAIGYVIVVILTFATFAGSLVYCVSEGPDRIAVKLLVASAVGSLGHVLFLGGWGIHRLEKDRVWRRRLLFGGGGVVVLFAGVVWLFWTVHRHGQQTAPICRA